MGPTVNAQLNTIQPFLICRYHTYTNDCSGAFDSAVRSDVYSHSHITYTIEREASTEFDHGRGKVFFIMCTMSFARLLSEELCFDRAFTTRDQLLSVNRTLVTIKFLSFQTHDQAYHANVVSVQQYLFQLGRLVSFS